MDTVYNNGSTGPFMQTFKFLDYSFMFIVYQEEKTAKSMVEGVDLLEKILGEDLFSEEVAIIKMNIILKKKKMNQDVHESSIVIQWLLVKKEV